MAQSRHAPDVERKTDRVRTAALLYAAVSQAGVRAGSIPGPGVHSSRLPSLPGEDRQLQPSLSNSGGGEVKRWACGVKREGTESPTLTGLRKQFTE